jgi:hypothetical protein
MIEPEELSKERVTEQRIDRVFQEIRSLKPAVIEDLLIGGPTHSLAPSETSDSDCIYGRDRQMCGAELFECSEDVALS